MSTQEFDQPHKGIEGASELQRAPGQPGSTTLVADEPSHLTIGSVTDALLKWDFYRSTGTLPPTRRTPFVGFSFFGEIGGFKPAGGESQYIHLKDSNDTISPPSTPPNKIVKTFAQWLGDLGARRINFSRVFAFANPPAQTAYYPYSVVGGQTAPYDLRAVAQRYTDRLNEYVAYAKTSNIVVCLTLFSDQSLRVGNGFEANPFNINKNKKPDYNFITPTSTDAVRRTFYNIAAPPNGWQNLLNPTIWNGWTIPQRLYAVQRFLVTELVNRTKRHWNIMYEISNEPVPIAGSNLDENWNFEVASWLDGLLWDPTVNRRKRLVQCNLGPTPPDRIATLTKLLAGAPHHLIDSFAFHGTEWSGKSASEPDIQTAIGRAVNALYNISITPTRKLSSYPIALIFDSDASNPAQINPYPFCHATLGIRGSYNHRWGSAHFLELQAKLDALNKVPGPANFVYELVDPDLTFYWDGVPQATGYRLTFQPTQPGGYAPPPVTLGPGAVEYSMPYTTPFSLAKTTIVALFGTTQTYPTVVLRLR
jgi:hypothetical protein